MDKMRLFVQAVAMEIFYAVFIRTLWIYYGQGKRNQQHEPVRTYSRECLMRWDNPSMGNIYMDPLVTEDILTEISGHRSQKLWQGEEAGNERWRLA